MDLSMQLHRIIEQDKLFAPGDRIVVAVSGGPDSTALLHLLFLLSARWGWSLLAAHANHGFRPEESEREAELVASQVKALGVPLAYRKLEVPARLTETGGNPQDVARELRYRFLIDTAKEWGARAVALAHHAGDQAETVLMRIIRGTGISGLKGMTAVREEQGIRLIRPLLSISKEELTGELERRSIPYCTDSSNEKLHYTRNRLRLQTLPHLESYNPSIGTALVRLAGLAGADDDFLEQMAADAVSRMAILEEGAARFSRKAWAELHVALQRRFIKLILNYLFFNMENGDFDAVELVRRSLLDETRPNLDLEVAGSIRLIREYDAVRLASAAAARPESGFFAYPLEGMEGGIVLPGAAGRVDYGLVPCGELHGEEPSPYEARFDAALLQAPLFIRNRRPGDRMRVDGLNGSKKVKDIFIDDKVPASLRERIPVLTDADGSLLWIPFIRRSDAAKVSEATRQVFRIFFRPE